MSMTTLNQKVALVTGASGGIGRATALELGRRGATVAVHYFRRREGADPSLGRNFEAMDPLEWFEMMLAGTPSSRDQSRRYV
jgi:NAD(P)-dependent dehydrogenase (short-subunit alcohol dehydrogenase family)